MLIALDLENFKGIADRQRVDFAPLTLLFGPNSAGKSTVMQALLYLHELLERGSADVDRTELGGDTLELGGFARLVHLHDVNRQIVLRMEFETPDSLERFGRDLAEFPFPDLDDQIKSAWIELTVRYRSTAVFKGPIIDRAVIGVGGSAEPLVWLEAGASLREGEALLARINLGHPVLGDHGRELTDEWRLIAFPEEFIQRTLKILRETEPTDYDGGVSKWSSVMDGGLAPAFAVSRFQLSAIPPISRPMQILPFNEERSEGTIPSQVRTFLEMVVLGTTAQLAASLREALYIGPLRAIPPRGFLYERAGRLISWADGLAAWDLLLADRLDLAERTNHWLKKWAECEVVVQELFNFDAAAEDRAAANVDEMVRRLLLRTGAGATVLPSEAGAGLSQVIPVVVAALDGRGGLFLVEQPELHIHPAMQVGLGDLFIDAVTRDRGRRTMLVETHSEHLILRLLRRIRETSAGDLHDGAPAFAADKLSVLYVENLPDGVRVQRLKVNEQGEFLDSWPRGFFDERFEEIYNP